MRQKETNLRALKRRFIHENELTLYEYISENQQIFDNESDKDSGEVWEEVLHERDKGKNENHVQNNTNEQQTPVQSTNTDTEIHKSNNPHQCTEETDAVIHTLQEKH